MQDIPEDVTPEEAARMVRALLRNSHQNDERALLLELCDLAIHSKNPGESTSMKGYRDAVRAGRRIKFQIFEIEVDEDDQEES